MTQSAEIKCINKQPRFDPYHRIVNVGGFTTERWKISVDVAIAHIENKTWEFYTTDGNRRAKVVVATHLGHKYLKTEADRDTPDNLLSLPECP